MLFPIGVFLYSPSIPFKKTISARVEPPPLAPQSWQKRAGKTLSLQSSSPGRGWGILVLGKSKQRLALTTRVLVSLLNQPTVDQHLLESERQLSNLTT